MFDTYAIQELYTSVLDEDIRRSRISERDIRLGVRDMAQAYAPEATNFESDITDRKFTNFNIAAFRCAYLHKYAPLHTYIVLDVMTKVIKQEIQLFNMMLNSKQFKLCCLGGGPGSDAVGVLAALHTVFNSFKCSVTVIDCMEQWKYTFGLVLNYLHNSGIGLQILQWDYIGSDLLQIQNMTAPTVANAINSASLITMVKFISAATCNNTEPMVEKIFRMMRPGALMLYIDNAAGGFTQVIERSSKKMNFQVIAGPFRHMEYEKEDLKTERFGYTSCFKTRVTIILLKKKDNNQNKTQIPSQLYYSTSQSTAASKTPLRDVQNTQVTLPCLTNKTQSIYQPNCSSQSISALKRKTPSQDVQSAKKVPSQIGVISPTFRNQAQNLPHPKGSSQSTSASKRKAPVSNINNASSKMHGRAQENAHKSMFSNSNIRPSSSRSTHNENVIRHFSNTSAPNMNNLNRQRERAYSQVVSRPPSTPVGEPLITPTLKRASRNKTNDNTDNYSNDMCCSCCVIS